ncbi:hypothetical protein GGI35DRAFT_442393 [Trichoderma velutinum]
MQHQVLFTATLLVKGALLRPPLASFRIGSCLAVVGLSRPSYRSAEARMRAQVEVDCAELVLPRAISTYYK